MSGKNAASKKVLTITYNIPHHCPGNLHRDEVKKVEMFTTTTQSKPCPMPRASQCKAGLQSQGCGHHLDFFFTLPAGTPDPGQAGEYNLMHLEGTG